eukprot:SAG31_NODE_159_length_21911_cov_12.220750_7_plen_150_part_00
MEPTVFCLHGLTTWFRVFGFSRFNHGFLSSTPWFCLPWAVVATQLGPACRTGLDSARLGVPVGPRAATHATLGPDAHGRPYMGFRPCMGFRLAASLAEAGRNVRKILEGGAWLQKTAHQCIVVGNKEYTNRHYLTIDTNNSTASATIIK